MKATQKQHPTERPEQTFDCVEMKRRGAEAVQQELEGLTPEERLAYWQRRTEALRRHRQTARTD